MNPKDINGYFFEILSEGKNIPKFLLDEFEKFMDGHSRTFCQIVETLSPDEKHAAELGFQSVDEYREHLNLEYEHNKNLKFSRYVDDKHHVKNIYATEAIFIDQNRYLVDKQYPMYLNHIILGKHSHQILSDIIFRNIRKIPKNIVRFIMNHFGIVDINVVIKNNSNLVFHSEINSDDEISEDED